MRRPVLFATCLCHCAFATGMTLVALAQEVTRPPIPLDDHPTGDAAANVDLVRRFYAAAEAVLATGEAAPLDAFVAPDLTEHPAQPGAASGRDGFVRALLALRATFPDLTLVVDEVRAAGEDEVLARVHAEGAGSGAFLGRPVPASAGQWGPVEVWRLEGGQIVERWSRLDPTVLLPLGQASISIDALGPGRRRVTVTRLIVEPKATLPVDNGQAIRVFAVDAGTLTVDVGGRFGGTIAVTRGSAMPAVSRPGETIAAMVDDLVATAPEAHYTLANTGPTPVVALVIVISNVLDGEWPQNSAAAAASWTVAAMPEALGGSLPSPAGTSARVLAAGVEVEMPAQPILEIGWVFLAPGETLTLPFGGGTLMAAVDSGSVDLAAAGGAPAATLAAGECTVVPAGGGITWRAGESSTVVLVLTVGQEATTR
jgi:predicted ester cyclase